MEIGHVLLRKSKETLGSVFHLFVSFAFLTGITYFRQDKLIIIKIARVLEVYDSNLLFRVHFHPRAVQRERRPKTLFRTYTDLSRLSYL